MNIKGLYKTSLVDYPGKVSSVIFTGGCNLRCGYCHNPELACNSDELEKIEDEEVFSFLEKRKGLIDGITVSGGEPTLDRGLLAFLRRIKSMGLLVKLDTNGFSPSVVEQCLMEKLADYIAVDLKTSPAKYSTLTKRDLNFNQILITLDIIRKSEVDYEIRTTCVPGFVTLEDITLIGEAVGHVRKWYLQQFVNTHTLIDPESEKLSPYPVRYLELMRDEALKYADRCSIRGI
ncbi:MAG TPA: anaerobic ribonucleoside-triphosphate reductase activating protein [Spirochaetota bacterium]|nr:anaerobic ribonucleoside-triphosphate reductase activating protein [Spirochaetota bacterium]HPF04507.1 anaerobic ribonucleoside-triphosphate reductase activating protein [Spirochaetota bacterium]HPJ42160.1 anaerobic ribonucleoside-triphosphate reductase activating protein [Spirochaetota bacterium]HPR38524.1 anaerobic ribonucleoside-triphosphate reductase activating protein [Spirochaetota bacterium]HRX46032.1 anaerobic ribonucleoside-triphosphate reductase activating protein [Spirochaetota ba